MPMLGRIIRFAKAEIPLYLRSRDRKSIAQQIKEMLALKKYYGYIPYQYLRYGLYLKSFQGDIFDYMPPEIIHIYRDSLNPSKEIKKVVNKVEFSRIMKEHDISVVPCIFRILRNGTILDQDGNEVSFEMFCKGLTDFGGEEFFIKPFDGGSGEGIEKLYVNNKSLILRGVQVKKDTIFDALFSRSRFDVFVIQPKIIQHDLLNDINSACVNTVRIDTLILDNQVVNTAAYLRVGIGASYIDNLSTGGFFVRIDMNTGELADYGITEAHAGRKYIYSHPVSGVVLKGLKMPFWNELKVLVNDAALALQPLKYLGWDVAIGNSEPIIIEANQDFGVGSIQDVAGGFRNTAAGHEILKELNITQRQ